MRFYEIRDDLHRFVSFDAFKDLKPEPYKVSHTMCYAYRRWLEKEIADAKGTWPRHDSCKSTLTLLTQTTFLHTATLPETYEVRVCRMLRGSQRRAHWTSGQDD